IGSWRYGFMLLVLSDYTGASDPGTLAFGLNFDRVDPASPGYYHEGLHSSNQVPLNEWVHLAATWDKQNMMMKVYINGVLDGTLDVSSHGNVSFFDPAVDVLHIGTRKNASYPNDKVVGKIDDARIWNVARTQAQIREAMYTELTGSETGLVAYYKLNEGSGQTVNNGASNNYHGTLGDDDPGTSNDPSWVVPSTAPIPYYTVLDGAWSTDATWATEQNAPTNDWASVEINHSVSLTTDETVEDMLITSSGDLTINSTKTLTVNGDFTIGSDNTGTGSFIDIGTVSYTSATVERYLTQNQWHFIGMPVSAASTSVFYLPLGSDIYLKTHIESTNAWGSLITSGDLLFGRGYACWVDDNVNQDETIEFSGTLNTGNYSTGTGGFYDLQYTTPSSPPPYTGYNLISNPYPSAIVADIGTWTKSNIDNSIWVWTGAPGSGNYMYWNGTDGTNTEGWGTLSGGIVPSMQAFFVKANNSNPSLTIPQSDRTHNSQSYYKDSGRPNSIRLDVIGNEYQDAIFVCFNEQATNGYDGEYDVRKIYGLDEAPQLYSIIPEDILSINSLSELNEYRIVPLGFECDALAVFTIEASEIESFEEFITIYLEDIKEGTLHNLSNNPLYTFTHEIGDDPARFLLHFGEPNGYNEPGEQSVRIYSNEDIVYVHQPAGLQADIVICNIMGQEIKREKVNNNELVRMKVANGTGYYVVKVKTSTQLFTQKVFIYNN
ncbi:MAG: T9SS type A sorting domain-containing protein, partial [Bacteroidales bacterium]|nr:T9SS type A sorting domain-containing protein [Bacteroidales bacterium]